MTFKLRERTELKTNYSPLERLLFDALHKGKGNCIVHPKSFLPIVDSAELAQLTKRKGPNARNIVVGAMKSMAAKAIKNREPWRIKHSPRRGPHCVSFWIESK